MQATRRLAASLVAAGLLSAACGGGESEEQAAGAGGDATTTQTEQASPTSPEGSGTDDASGAKGASGCPEIDGWDELLAAAKDEGVVTVGGPPNPDVRENLTAAFEELTGVSIEYTGARTGEIVARVTSERDAGQYTLDVLIGGANSQTGAYKSGMFTDLRELLLDDPLIFDDSNYAAGEMGWLEPEERHVLRISDYVALSVSANPNEVGSQNLKVWEDLLAEEFSGRIVAIDPRQPGSGVYVPAQLLEEYGEEFVADLYSSQDPALLTDGLQATNDLARGRYAVGLALYPADVDIAVSQGLPIERVVMEDLPEQRTAGYGWLSVLDQAPHPAAAQLFANWIACPEGALAWSAAQDSASARNDVEPDVPEWTVVQPAEEYWDQNEWDRLQPGAIFDQTKELLTEVTGSDR